MPESSIHHQERTHRTITAFKPKGLRGNTVAHVDELQAESLIRARDAWRTSIFLVVQNSCYFVYCLLVASWFSANTARGDPVELMECANAFQPELAIVGCSEIIGSNWATDDQLALAYNNRANARDDQGKPEDAIFDYNRALAIDPHYVNARYNRATLYLRLERLALAIADFDLVLQLEPKRADAANNRSLAYLKIGNLDEAIAGFSAAIQLDPSNAYAYNNRGVAWRRKNERDNAIADFSIAIDLLPNYAAALNSRGELQKDIGRLELATADFCKAVAIAPRHAKASTNLNAVIDILRLH